jgi:hypothetical protein
MQSERVKVLVGSTKDTFEVPYDLLAQYSTAFKKLRNALNDAGDEISLPDVTKSTFEDFFIWLHAYEPNILHTESHDSDPIDGALNLAVFAQKYQIYHLRNQASDVVRAALREGQWNITPDMISAVYKVAPAGSALRQLSFLGFVAAEGRNDSTVWQAAFIDCPSLGWDYFQYKSGSELYSEGIEAGGACHFHDHSDIRGWVLRDLPDCPYPHGAPRPLPEELVVPTPVSTPAVHDIVVQGAVDPPPVEKKAVPLPPVEEAVEVTEAEPVEIHPVEETTVEPSIGQQSESAWGASETTETELVEAETQKFEPAEQPLVEETVEDWVSKTKEAEPIVVENLPLPAEDEASHVKVGNARMQVENARMQVEEDKEDVPVVSKVTLRRMPVAEEKKEPTFEVTEQGPVVVSPPVVENAEVAQETSEPMGRTESTMSVVAVENQSGAKGKKGKKKGRKQSLVATQN